MPASYLRSFEIGWNLENLCKLNFVRNLYLHLRVELILLPFGGKHFGQRQIVAKNNVFDLGPAF
jgi:hypothetical protein